MSCLISEPNPIPQNRTDFEAEIEQCLGDQSYRPLTLNPQIRALAVSQHLSSAFKPCVSVSSKGSAKTLRDQSFHVLQIIIGAAIEWGPQSQGSTWYSVLFATNPAI